MSTTTRFLAATALTFMLAAGPSGQARAAAPDGSYSIGGDASSHPIIDVSGSYSETLSGVSISYTISVEENGKFSGTFSANSADLPAAMTGTVKGKIKGVNENLRSTVKLKGNMPLSFAGSTENVKISYVEKLNLDTVANTVTGTVKIALRSKTIGKVKESTTVSDTVSNYYGGLDNSWTANVSVSAAAKGTLSGSGSLLLNSSGGSHDLNVSGKYKVKKDMSKLKAMYTSIPGLIKVTVKKMTTSGSNVTGGTVKYKALGQKGRFTIN